MSKGQQRARGTKVKAEIKQAFEEAKSTFASTTSLIISALTLVAGLAWNDVAKALFERLKEKLSGWGETVGLFLYALSVTAIAVLIIHRLRKIQKVVGGKSIKKAPKKI
jgi:ABC-type Fe3+ transport system permease subunit